MRLVLLAALTAIACALAFSGCSSSTSPDDAGGMDASFTASPAEGTAITDFTLDASASSVTRSMDYRWDWDGDGTWDTEWLASPVMAHRFDDLTRADVVLEAREGTYSDTACRALDVDTRHGHVLAINSCPTDAPWVLGTAGSELWMSDWNTKRIYRMDPATGDTLESFPPLCGWPSGIAYDGQSLWVTDWDYGRGMAIYQVDPETWETGTVFPVTYSALPGGLAWDGEYLYHGSYIHNPAESDVVPGRDGQRPADGHIYKYATDGTQVGVFDSPRGHDSPCGLAFDGMYLWVSTRQADTLYVVNPDDGTVLRTVPVSDLSRAIAVFGDHIWAVCDDYSEEFRKIVP